jgi:plasmid stabilization system protein ParE
MPQALPRLRFAQDSLHDLQRLREFLRGKSPEVAQRMQQQLLESIQSLPRMPEAHRPVPDMPWHRELIVKFGAQGYVVRYHYQPGGEAVVLRMRHQREDAFGSA